MRKLFEYETPDGEGYELSCVAKGKYYVFWKRHSHSDVTDALMCAGGIKTCMDYVKERIMIEEDDDIAKDVSFNNQQVDLIRDALCELAKKHHDKATQETIDGILNEIS